jgi:hypothetical protein
MPVKSNLVAKGKRVMPALTKDADTRDLKIAIQVCEIFD